MIIGSIKFNDKVIVDIDVNNYYLHEINSFLIPSLMFYMGIDYLYIICDKIYEPYYAEFGLEKYRIKDDKMLIMKYSVGNEKGKSYKKMLKNALNKILGKN